MIITLIIIGYLTGCVLAYGRLYAYDYAIQDIGSILFAILVITSWFGFIVGVILYFFEDPDQQYWFKFKPY